MIGWSLLEGAMRCMVYLPSLFTRFCEYFDGKLNWSKMRGDLWTDLVLKFFEEEAQRERARPQREYMTLDLVWWGQYTQLVFALEHESSHREVNRLLDEEVSHLIDVRAKSKVGIFYPAVGDEDIFVKNVEERLYGRAYWGSKIPNEEYLFVLGFPATRQRKSAIKFKAYFYDDTGKRTGTNELVILQAEHG